jgi:signal transduction histidine kinase
MVRITVSDTGRGLDSAQCARLFTAFERLDADRQPIEGTGIGLALSKRLVELMGGSIGVHSIPGVGSRFWVDLPQAKAGDAAPGHVHAAASMAQTA